MRRPAILLGLLAWLMLGVAATNSVAQSTPTAPGTPVCRCAAMAVPHYHPGARPGPSGASGNDAGNPAVSPNERGLPRGRHYYGGRYFGSFNNRYYGPQYGYF